MTKPNNKYNPCIMTGFNCYGCCAVNSTNYSDAKKGVENNTEEYKDMKNLFEKNKGKIETDEANVEFHQMFRDRYGKDELDKSGLCLNLINLNENKLNGQTQPTCAIHCGRLNGYDPRVGYCSTVFECMSFKRIQNWDEEQVQMFNRFVKEQFENGKLNHLSFSNGMFNNTLITDFFTWQNKFL